MWDYPAVISVLQLHIHQIVTYRPARRAGDGRVSPLVWVYQQQPLEIQRWVSKAWVMEASWRCKWEMGSTSCKFFVWLLLKPLITIITFLLFAKWQLIWALLEFLTAFSTFFLFPFSSSSNKLATFVNWQCTSRLSCCLFLTHSRIYK